MKYIIIEFESVYKFADGTSTKTEKILIEFQDVKYNDWGSIDLINAHIIKRKNPDTVIELHDNHAWKYKENMGSWHGLNGFSQGYYEKNVIDNRDDAELLFELKE